MSENISPESVRALSDQMMRAVGDNVRDGEGLVFTYLSVQEAFEPFARAYLALSERVGEIADDFHPDSDKDAPLALQEMREALLAALSHKGMDHG